MPQASLNTMKEGHSEMALLKARFSSIERELNTLEFQQDSFISLQSLKDAGPSLLKMQQTISDMQKRSQTGLAKAEDNKKRLEELKANIRDFHRAIGQSLSGEITKRETDTKGFLAELQNLRDKIADLETRLDANVADPTAFLTQEISKLSADFAKHLEDFKNQTLEWIYQKEKDFWDQIGKLKGETSTIKEEIAARRPKDGKVGFQFDRVEQLIREEVAKGFKATFNEFAADLFLDNQASDSPIVATLQRDATRFHEDIEQELDTIQRTFEEFTRNCLDQVLEPDKARLEALENVTATKKQIEALKKVVADSAIRRGKEVESLSRSGKVEAFLNKAKQADAQLDKRLAQLQAKIDINGKKILAYAISAKKL